MSAIWSPPRMAGSWKVPKRMKDGDTRHTTAPGSYLALPLHRSTTTDIKYFVLISTSALEWRRVFIMQYDCLSVGTYVPIYNIGSIFRMQCMCKCHCTQLKNGI